MRARLASTFALVVLAAGCSVAEEPAKKQPPIEGPPAPKALAQISGVTELEDINPDPDIVEVNLTAAPADMEIVSGHTTHMLSFNGSTPGPMLHARVGNRIIVHFQNNLAEPTTIHWHGLRILPEMDGNPMVVAPIPAGGSFTYDFVAPDPGTFWYHPHVDTIEQIPRGLYAPIVIEEKDAPVFTGERMHVIADTRLNASYQHDTFRTPMDMMMGRFGDRILANGTTKPVGGTIARGAVERWRIVNVAPARTMEIGVEGASFRVIGTDGGLLPEPFTTNRLVVTVGQRYDLEVTADDPNATEVKLVGHFPVQASNGTTKDQVMPFAVYTVDGDVTAEPPVYPTVTLPELPPSFDERKLVLSDMQDAQGKVIMTMNGMDGMKLPMAEFTQGSPVRFTIKNSMMHAHPFHFHGQFFQILTRNGKPANEPGLKDVVFLDGMDTVTIATNFENPGEWMYHCHIAEHAEQGMMAELMVSPP